MKKLLLFTLLWVSFGKAPAQSNYSLSFNGSASADCGTGADFDITGTSITVEAWIYPTSFTTYSYEESIVAKDYPLYTGYALRCGGSGQLSFVFGVTGGVWVEALSGNNVITLNQWQHVAAVYNGTSIMLYVNGVLVQSVSENRSLVEDNTIPVKIGGSPGGWLRYFSGQIDEVRIWNLARTVAAIRDNLFKKITTGTGLVAVYSMTDGSGTSLTDNSGNGHTATLSAGTSWQSSPIQFSANALSFDGTDDIVTIARQPIHDISTAITLEAWVYATKNDGGVQNVIAKSAASSASGYIFPRTDDGWTNITCWLYIAGTGWRSFAAPYSGLNAWHHLAATYDGSNVKIYVDGVLKLNQTQTGLIVTSSSVNITLGNQPGLTEYFGGAADELRIWNIARSQSAIQADMNRELNVDGATGLVAYFTNNQGIAAGTNSGLNFIQDLAGTQNGTLSNFSLTGNLSNFISQHNALTVLPLRLISFTASKQDVNVLLKWKTAEEINIRDFSVFHSLDGAGWEEIGTVLSTINHQYFFTHNSPGSGSHYYRLRQKEADGSFSYSSICRIELSSLQRELFVFPNPVSGPVLNIYMNASGIVSLYNRNGSCIRIVQLAAGWQKLNINGLAAGVYYIRAGEKGFASTVVINGP